jgi:hypothetical protein
MRKSRAITRRHRSSMFSRSCSVRGSGVASPLMPAAAVAPRGAEPLASGRPEAASRGSVRGPRPPRLPPPFPAALRAPARARAARGGRQAGAARAEGRRPGVGRRHRRATPTAVFIRQPATAEAGTSEGRGGILRHKAKVSGPFWACGSPEPLAVFGSFFSDFRRAPKTHFVSRAPGPVLTGSPPLPGPSLRAQRPWESRGSPGQPWLSGAIAIFCGQWRREGRTPPAGDGWMSLLHEAQGLFEETT